MPDGTHHPSSASPTEILPEYGLQRWSGDMVQNRYRLFIGSGRQRFPVSILDS